MPRHTAKFHLDKLVEEGLLDTEFRRLGGRQGPGAGRPTKLYRRSDREVVGDRPRAALRPGRRAARVGGRGVGPRRYAGARFAASRWPRRWARGSATRPARLPGRGRGRDKLVGATCDVLAGHGYEPRAEGRTVTLANCPFHALARDHTELVCDMNLALVSAVARNGADARLSARLEPADGRCCVVLDVH